MALSKGDKPSLSPSRAVTISACVQVGLNDPKLRVPQLGAAHCLTRMGHPAGPPYRGIENNLKEPESTSLE
jgi:hypothetical protein